MSFRMHISARSRKAARFISSVHRELQEAYMRASRRGITQQNIADVLDVDRSAVNRRLQGGGNLTLRTLSDLAFAMDEDIALTFSPRIHATANYRVGDVVVSGAQGTRTATPAGVITSSVQSRVVSEYV